MKDDQRDSLLACLAALARSRGLQMPYELQKQGETGEVVDFSKESIKALATKFGLELQYSVCELDDILNNPKAQLPCLAVLKNGNAVLMTGLDPSKGELFLYDPLAVSPGNLSVPFGKFTEAWGGDAWLVYGSVTKETVQPEKGSAWISREILKYKDVFLSIVLSGLIVNSLSLVTPFFLMIVLDRVVQYNAWTTLTVLGVGAVVLVIFETLFDYLKNVFLVKASKDIDWNLQTEIYMHFLRLPQSVIKRGQKGIWSRNLLEVERIRAFVTNRALSVGLDLLFVVVFAIALLWIDLVLFLVALGGAVLQLALSFIISPLLRHRISQNVKADSFREAYLAESIASIDMLKSLGVERFTYAKWRSIISGMVLNRFKLQSLVATNRAISGLIDKATSIAIVWIGASLVMKGATTVGALVAANILARRITGPVVQLISLTQEYHEVRASIDTVSSILEQSAEQTDATGGLLMLPVEGRFEFENVQFSYPDNKTFDVLLNGKLPSGALIAVVGGSGSGKSTLAKLLLGLESPKNGVLRVDGHDLRSLDYEHYRNQIGTVLQDVRLMRGTVRENISIGKQNAPFNEIVNAAKMAGADYFIQHLPNGYDTHLDEDAANLSGGQKQRIALARALVRNPKILILDEVTSALDPESEMAIVKNLEMLRKGRTVMVITHRLTTIVGADLILFMDAGRIAARGTHAQLMASCEQYRDLWHAQNEAAFQNTLVEP